MARSCRAGTAQDLSSLRACRREGPGHTASARGAYLPVGAVHRPGGRLRRPRRSGGGAGSVCSVEGEFEGRSSSPRLGQVEAIVRRAVATS